MPITVCIAGLTGWAGSALAKAVVASPDMTLVSGVSRKRAGESTAAALGLDPAAEPGYDGMVFGNAEEAMRVGCDVFVEYTAPSLAKANVLAALKGAAHVVIGTSGLSDDDLAEIGEAAERAKRGVLAVGNFAISVVLLQKFAETAARFIPNFEVIDYAADTKVDAPSGTVRELAARLASVDRPDPAVPVDETVGERDARGATLGGVQVHSLRLPGYVIGAEVLFGLPDERLTLKVEGGSSATPYVNGGLLAIREVGKLTGLHRGLGTVLDL